MNSHENNHAAPSNACQLNAVRRLTLSAALIASPAITSLSGQLRRLDLFRRRLFALWGTQSINSLRNFRDQIKRIFFGFNGVAVSIVKPRNKAFAGNLIFWMLGHWNSSFLGCSKQRMDDSGHYGNVAPNARCECGRECFQK